jgi:hypothetical protein
MFPWRAGALLLAAALASAAAHAAPAATVLAVDGARLEVELDAETFRAGGAVLIAWIRRSAQIVAGYYGRFPAARLTIRVRPQDGAGVQGGSTFGVPQPLIRVRVGREVTEAQLLRDWVLVHEMIHLALPDVGPEHAWLSEGLATYVEGVARVQAGNRAEEDVWAEEFREMPYGLPQPGDAGLDRTHSWGRTYWGGAMFCLMADVDIRRATDNRLGLEDALRAILRASGGLATDWPIERVLRTGDAAVGTTTLEDLYARLRDRPVTPDLVGLWRELGVEPEGSSVRLSDGAPLAPLRHAIMRAKRSPS